MYRVGAASLRLLDAGLHVHRAKRGLGGQQVLASLRLFSSQPAHVAEPETAERGERPHPELVGQRQRLIIVRGSVPDIGRVGARCDDPEKPQGPRLLSPLAATRCELEGMGGGPGRLVESRGEKVTLAEKDLL